jgi:hypothetical protein
LNATGHLPRHVKMEEVPTGYRRVGDRRVWCSVPHDLERCGRAAAAMRPCRRHPDSPRYPSGGCIECGRANVRAQRAAARKARPRKKLSPRQKAMRAGKKYYRNGDCVHGRKNALRRVTDSACLECGRSVYPQRLSAATRKRQRIQHRDYSRRRARALRLIHELGITL